MKAALVVAIAFFRLAVTVAVDAKSVWFAAVVAVSIFAAVALVMPFTVGFAVTAIMMAERLAKLAVVMPVVAIITTRDDTVVISKTPLGNMDSRSGWFDAVCGKRNDSTR